MLQILTLVAALVAPGPVADWTISAQPVLEIHGHWGSIAGVTRLPSGRIFVSDRMSREISIHSAAGSLLATVGGPGSGPGEFRTLNRPLLCGGDSVYFWDSGLGRISIFDADGSYRRSFSDLEVRSLDGRFQGVTDVSCSPTGVFVATSFSMDRPLRQEGINRLEVDRPIGPLAEDSVEDDEVEMKMRVERRSEAVQEGDGAELGVRGRAETGGAEGRADGTEEDPQDGAGDLRVVV